MHLRAHPSPACPRIACDFLARGETSDDGRALTAYVLPRFAASHDPPTVAALAMNPIASAEESLTTMWVGDSPSYSVPFDSSRERKIHYWQNGFSVTWAVFLSQSTGFKNFDPLHRSGKNQSRFCPGHLPDAGYRTLPHFLQYSICAISGVPIRCPAVSENRAGPESGNLPPLPLPDIPRTCRSPSPTVSSNTISNWPIFFSR